MQKRLEKKELRIYDFLFFLAKREFMMCCGGIYGYKCRVWKVVRVVRIRPLRQGYTRPIDGPQLAWDWDDITPLSPRYRTDPIPLPS